MNGVGGCTISEAKSRLSYREFFRWVAYRRRRGSLNIGTRIETSGAILATLYANVHSKQKYSRFDFMDHDDGPPIDLNKAMEEWR